MTSDLSLFDSSDALTVKREERSRAYARDARPTLTGQPLARNSDPVTSHTAAKSAKKKSAELERAIRWWVSKQREPKSAFDIADALCGSSWQHDTVRSAVSRAGLHAVDTLGRTRGGRQCIRYVLRSDACAQ